MSAYFQRDANEDAVERIRTALNELEQVCAADSANAARLGYGLSRLGALLIPGLARLTPVTVFVRVCAQCSSFLGTKLAVDDEAGQQLVEVTHGICDQCNYELCKRAEEEDVQCSSDSSTTR